MIEAELPDGTVLEFPGGTAPAVVQAAVKRRLASAGAGSGAANPTGVAMGSARPNQKPVEGSGGAAFGITPSSGLNRLQDTGGSEKFRQGFANAGIEAALGAKQLFKNLSPEEMEVLKMSRDDVAKAGGWGGLGRVTGGVGAGIATAIASPNILPAAVSALVKAVLASGAQSAAFTPVENQDDKYTEKLKEGAKGAAAALVMNGGAKVLKKALTGAVTPTPEAAKLMGQDVTPTLQQGAESRFAKFIGGLTSGSTHVRDRQEQEVLDALTERATKGNISAKDHTLSERLAAIQHSLDNDYEGVLGKKLFPMNNKIREGVLSQATALQKSGGRNASEAAQAESILQNVIGADRNAVRLKADTLRKDYLDRIQSEISDSNPRLVNDALVSAKNLIMKNSRDARLTSDELSALRDIDTRYFDLMRLKDVAKGSAGNDTGVPIKRIADAYGKGPGMDIIGAVNQTNEDLIGPAFRVLGKMPRQDEARTGMINLRRAAGLTAAAGAGAATIGAAPTAALIAPAYATSLLGQTRGGSRFLFGQNDWQKNLKSGLNSEQTNELVLANLLRAMRDNSSGVGAGLTVGE